MAFTSGSVADFDALFSTLLTELTSNTDLVNAGQAWTQEWNVGDQYVLRGPGLAGTDNIYIGLEKIKDSGSTVYDIRLYGMKGFNASAANMSEHVGVAPAYVKLMAADSAMNYWLTMSGRRFVFVVKVSTYYEALYGGFYLPFVTPAEYPYPLFTGGAGGPIIDSNNDPLRWNDAVWAHRIFTDPMYDEGSSGSHLASPSARFLPPDGLWNTVNHYRFGPQTYVFFPTVHNYNCEPSTGGFHTKWWDDEKWKPWSHVVVEKSRECLGGGYPATPLSIVRRGVFESLGTLDGVFRVPSNGLTAEAAITIDGDPAIVFPNVWRQDARDMWAIKTV